MATLVTLVVKLTGNTTDFVDKMNDAEKTSKGVVGGIKKNLAGLGKAMAVGAVAVSGAAVGIGGGLMKLAAD
jgi:hypothetical protein